MSRTRTSRIGWRMGLATFGLALAASAPGQSRAATLTTLASFDGADGSRPRAGLIADAVGNLLGTTDGGGAHDGGTVFELVKTAGGYAGAPTALVSFCSLAGCADGFEPQTALVADAHGNLFGTTSQLGGVNGHGTAFELVNTTGGYARTPTTLVTFSLANSPFPTAGLLTDNSGNLFGTTDAGGGAVFEIVKTAGGYASTPTILASIQTTASSPQAGLIADAAGNLFGTTASGGANGSGSVFEVPKTANGYAATAVTLASFNGANGENPVAPLIIDASGNLFGTTSSGGTNFKGTVFEIVKTAGGYANTPSTLVSFDGVNGAGPVAGLIADARGNLFGTTEGDIDFNDGTVFEVGKTAGGYAATPTVLVTFTGANGGLPEGGLIADAHGNLFGTTSAGGASDAGTVFEITGSGFVVPTAFAGTPGLPSCHGKSVAALARKYSGLSAAATALGYSGVPALQHAIAVFCEA